MPFKKTPPTRTTELCDLAEDWGKVIARRAFGYAGPPDEVAFDTFEQIAVDAAQALIRGNIEQVLRHDTQRLGPVPPCPQCGHFCPVRIERRDLVVRGATVHTEELVVAHLSDYPIAIRICSIVCWVFTSISLRPNRSTVQAGVMPRSRSSMRRSRRSTSPTWMLTPST